MRVVQIDEFGGPEVLQVVDVPNPEPGDGEVLTGSAASLAEVYPHHGDFVAVRNRLDPDRTFTNPYLDRVLGA